MLEGVRTLLVRAGLPACFWPFACWQYCLADNIRPPTDDKPSLYALTNGEERTGPLIPFGVGVIYKPSSSKSRKVGKMEGATSSGIFAGYVVDPGYVWKGAMRVWDVSDFLGVDLRSDAPSLTGSISLKQPHTVEEVKLPMGDYVSL